MTALRTARGLDLDDFSARFGIDPESAFGPLHDEFPELVSLVGRAWRPTDRGLDTLNIPLVSALERADAYYSSR
jgi:hypothetical protein